MYAFEGQCLCLRLQCCCCLFCLSAIFYTALCCCLLTTSFIYFMLMLSLHVYLFIPFFILKLLLYFCLFVDHVNKPIIFGAFVYHFKNTISIFVYPFSLSNSSIMHYMSKRLFLSVDTTFKLRLFYFAIISMKLKFLHACIHYSPSIKLRTRFSRHLRCVC